MKTYHALTPVAQPDLPPKGTADALAIAPSPPPGLATDAEPEPSESPAAIVSLSIEELARERARRMLERALAVELNVFLGCPRHERRTVAEHGYRNGYGRPRAVPIGTSGRLLNGGLTIMTLLLGGARFVDGVYVPAPDAVSAA